MACDFMRCTRSPVGGRHVKRAQNDDEDDNAHVGKSDCHIQLKAKDVSRNYF